jgi:Ca-activated chloride channel family protein
MKLFEAYTFVNEELLWLMALVPVLLGWYVWRYRTMRVEMKVSNLSTDQRPGTSWRVILRHSLIVIRLSALCLIIIAMARPQTRSTEEKITTEGIDIVLAMDISSSMLAEDFQPNRIKAAKDVAIEFIKGRPNDRIGMVVFAGESFTQCPITTDHMVLTNLMSDIINDIEDGLIEDGTAIGMGLATAVNRLRDSDASSKVIILLTDGVNNSGFVAPLTAAEIAQEFGVRVYAIGVGTMGMAPYPVRTPFGIRHQQMPVEIDEELLQQITQMTDGMYFRATDNKKLKEIYQEIDHLEKTKIEQTTISRHSEEYLWFAWMAAVLLFTEILFRNTIFRSLL